MNKLFAIGAMSLAIVSVVGVGTVSVSALNGQGNQSGTGLHAGDGTGSGYGNGYQTSLESRAKVLNMTADQLKTALETKTMSQLAVDKGISEADFEARMGAAATARWEARGLSSEEIATRTAERNAQQTANEDHEFGSGLGEQSGYGHNR